MIDAVAARRRARATTAVSQGVPADASGYARSNASTGVLRVFVIPVWTPLIPGCPSGRPPCPPPTVS